MYEAFQKEIARLVTLVKTAELVDEKQVLWCLSRLPAAYQELARSYESRFADSITSHQQAALGVLTADTCQKATLLADKLHGKFQSLNERFGLRALPPQRVPRAPTTKRPRKAKESVTPAE